MWHFDPVGSKREFSTASYYRRTTAQTAVNRARAKYGPKMDLTTWRFFVRERFAYGPTLEFRADEDDRAVQLER